MSNSRGANSGTWWPEAPLHLSTDSRPHPILSSPSGSRNIREDFHHVIQGLGPLMEQSRTVNLRNWFRSSNLLLGGQVHPTATQSSQHSPTTTLYNVNEPDSSRASNGLRAGNHDRSEVVVSLENESNSQLAMQTRLSRENSTHGSSLDGLHTSGNNNNDPTTPDAANGQNAAGLRQSPELMSAVSVVEKYMPFFLILLAKLIFDHKIGILVMFGLIITFIHANSVIKREVGKQAKRNTSSLLAVIINLLTCIVFIYYVFDSDKLYNNLVFLPAYKHPIRTLWDLLWVVGVTDFVLKLMTIVCKAIVVLLPASLLAFQKKGKYYLFIEQTSQTYRAVTPIRPWLFYLFDAYEGVGKLVGVILCIAYIIAKGNHLIRRFREWRGALSKLMQSVTYGSAPTREQIDSVGNMCPICQDDFRQPTILNCKHLFCEECVTLWFDRERTCPMCRAQIADDPAWRDGTTAYFLQLF